MPNLDLNAFLQSALGTEWRFSGPYQLSVLEQQSKTCPNQTYCFNLVKLRQWSILSMFQDCKWLLRQSFGQYNCKVIINDHPQRGYKIGRQQNKALVKWLCEETRVVKVGVLNPSPVYRMYIFTLVCCNVCFKTTRNKQKEAGNGPFKKCYK